MTLHLITFLGKQTNGYRTANYQFDNCIITTKVFGLALFENLVKTNNLPDRVVILGTSTSMWDVFAQDLQGDNLAVDLVDAIESGLKVRDLEPLALHISNLLNGYAGYSPKVELKIIDKADSRKSQVSLLNTIVDGINTSDQVILDVTHGFRHLPMITLTAALYMREALKAEIKGIYYGALEMTPPDQITPVLTLTGLLDIADWITAISAVRSSGDLNHLSELLDKDYPPLADHIQQAAILQRCFQVGPASKRLDNASKEIKNIPEDSPSWLFKDQLQNEISWKNGSDLASKQKSLALKALDRGDYLRAVIFGLEAKISANIKPEFDPYNYYVRQESKSDLKKSDDYDILNNIRNALVHSSRLSGRFSKYEADLRDAERLNQLLKKLI